MRYRSGLTFGGVVVFATAAWVAGCSGPSSQVPQIASQAPAIVVKPDIKISPSSLGVEMGKSTSFTAKQKNYHGKFHSVGSRQPCKGVATWSPHRGSGPTLHVTVKGVAPGYCVFGLTNAIGKSVAWARVTVQPTPSPSPTPPNVKLYSIPVSSGGGNDPIGITVGADRNLWFTISSGAIGRITTSGKISLFTKGIPVASGLQGIAAGADGNVWFTGKFGVGRITTSGAVTLFKSSYPGFAPAGIASVQGGALAVSGCDSTDGCGAYSVSTTGTIAFIGRAACDTGYPSGPFSIASGAGNTVWTGGGSCVAEFGSSSGAFNFLYGDEEVTSVTEGPDGNEWFVTGSEPEVGNATSSGTITRYPTGLTGAGESWITAIASGPDGNLWFAASDSERGGVYLGRATTTGVVTLFNMGSHGPDGLTFGPDGGIWFTTPGAIARTPLPPA
ncbi:MAG TPA: hypothetical protein VGG89_13340 [Candidatus Baltobacteraceae bacterium]|jgi:streptogramin lyase